MRTIILTLVVIVLTTVSSFANTFTKSWNGQLWTIKNSEGTVVIIMEKDLLPNKSEDITIADLQSLKLKKSTWYCVNNFCL